MWHTKMIMTQSFFKLCQKFYLYGVTLWMNRPLKGAIWDRFNGRRHWLEDNIQLKKTFKERQPKGMPLSRPCLPRNQTSIYTDKLWNALSGGPQAMLISSNHDLILPSSASTSTSTFAEASFNPYFFSHPTHPSNHPPTHPTEKVFFSSAKPSFNFNYNLVGSWDIFTLQNLQPPISPHIRPPTPTTHP